MLRGKGTYDQEEQMDYDDGQKIPVQQGLAIPELINLPEAVKTIITTAGTLETDDKQREILYAPPDRDEIQIRPDGLIYLPWVFWARRLKAAFGTSWVVVQSGEPQMENNLILVRYMLFIQGKYVGTAYGEQEFHPNNKTMSYGDAIEATQSNAITRLCKHLGMCEELWSKDYIETWKKEYAVTYIYHNKQKNQDETRWKKKKGKVIEGEQEDQKAGKPESQQEEDQNAEEPKGKPGAATNGRSQAVMVRYNEIGRIKEKIGWSSEELRGFCSRSFPKFTVIDDRPALSWVDNELVMVSSADEMSSNQLSVLVEELKALESFFDSTKMKPPIGSTPVFLRKNAFAIASEKNISEDWIKAVAYEKALLDTNDQPVVNEQTGEVMLVTSRSQLRASQWIEIIKQMEGQKAQRTD